MNTQALVSQAPPPLVNSKDALKASRANPILGVLLCALIAGCSTKAREESGKAANEGNVEEPQGAGKDVKETEEAAKEADATDESAPSPALVIKAEELSEHLPFHNEEEILSRLQGSWVFDTGIHNVPSAWHIKGHDFTSLRPDFKEATSIRTRKGQLQVLAPCRIAHVDTALVTTVTNYSNILVTKDGLHQAAVTGERRGSNYVVCSSQGIFTGTSAGCYRWTSKPDAHDDLLLREKVQCRFERGQGGAEYFHAQAGDDEIKAPVHGDIISTWPPDSSAARRVSDLEKARAAITAWRAKSGI